MSTPTCARRGALAGVCAALLAFGWLLRCVAPAHAAELPPSTGAAAGQAATVRPLLPPGPLGPLNEADLEFGAAFAPSPAAGPMGSPPLAGPLGPPGVPAAALAQPPGAMMGPETAVGPRLGGAPDPEHHPAAPCGCQCPDCAAAGEGPHIYAPASMVPMFAPTEEESLLSGWLPEIQEAWFGRPLYGGAYAGVMLGSEIIASQLKLEPGLLTGVRFGEDCDRRWSWETHVAYANSSVVNLEGAALRRDADFFLTDTSLIYARYATKRLRPYLSAGAGMAYLDLTDQNGHALREFLPTVPLGAGVQYRYDDWLVLHLDVRDNLLFGRQAELEPVIHNLSISGGIELRFGTHSNVYYPWTARAQSE